MPLDEYEKNNGEMRVCGTYWCAARDGCARWAYRKWVAGGYVKAAFADPTFGCFVGLSEVTPIRPAARRFGRGETAPRAGGSSHDRRKHRRALARQQAARTR